MNLGNESLKEEETKARNLTSAWMIFKLRLILRSFTYSFLPGSVWKLIFSSVAICCLFHLPLCLCGQLDLSCQT